jgi:hypothetical protein
MIHPRSFVAHRYDRSAAFPLLVFLSFAAGCEFHSIGDGNGPGPDLGCSLDLEAFDVRFDVEPLSAGSPPQANPVVQQNQPFFIVWSHTYDGSYDFFFDGTEVYNTHVEILKDDEVIFAFDFESDTGPGQVAVSHEIYVPEGLPAGQYLVTVEADAEGLLPECSNGLVAALNNTAEADLMVVIQSVDDFAPQTDDDGGTNTDTDPVDTFIPNASPSPQPADPNRIR